MPNPVFPNKLSQPTPGDLSAVLGRSASLLEEIENFLVVGDHSPGREWKFYSKAAGWTLALKSKKRNVLHLLPHEGSFTVVFTFGERAVEACRGADLPDSILALIEGARVYAEGRSFRFPVSSPVDVSNVVKLLQIKLAY